MTLPASWVERLFDRLSLVYGAHFLGRWSGLDLAAVKASWARELAGFAQHPAALVYGLAHLPADQPPTVLAFRDLCRPALRDERQEPPPALPAPPADPQRVAAIVAAVDRNIVHDPRGWARALRDREAAEKVDPPGQRLRMTAYQRDAWRAALPADQARDLAR